jgi:hypothetical protein
MHALCGEQVEQQWLLEHAGADGQGCGEGRLDEVFAHPREQPRRPRPLGPTLVLEQEGKA